MSGSKTHKGRLLNSQSVGEIKDGPSNDKNSSPVKFGIKIQIAEFSPTKNEPLELRKNSNHTADNQIAKIGESDRNIFSAEFVSRNRIVTSNDESSIEAE